MTMMHCSTMVIGLKWWCRCSEYWSVCWPQSLKVKLKECWLMIHVGYRVFLKKQSSFLWPTHLNLAVSVYKETISKIDQLQHRVWILRFHKGKSAKNEPKIGNFQNLPKTHLIHMKQVSHPPLLGIVDDKKWCPYFYWGTRRPIFCTQCGSCLYE